IIIGVAGEARPQTIARLARKTMADAVGQDQVVAAGIEQLPRPKELASELLAQKGFAAAAGSMKNKHSVRHPARPIASRRTKGCIVQPHIGQPATIGKAQIAYIQIALERLWNRHVHSIHRFWILDFGLLLLITCS